MLYNPRELFPREDISAYLPGQSNKGTKVTFSVKIVSGVTSHYVIIDTLFSTLRTLY